MQNKSYSLVRFSPCLPEFVSSGLCFDIVLNLQESYVMLEKAIRSLASFYSKAGPSAALPEEVKSEILDDLNKAEGGL